jgi:hypothetical protein
MEQGAGTRALRRLERFAEIEEQIEFLDSSEFWQRDFDVVIFGASQDSETREKTAREKTRKRSRAPSAVWVPNAERLTIDFSNYTPSETDPHLLLRGTP